MNLNQVTVEVTDIERSRTFYARLGLILIVSSDHYARFVCPAGPGEAAATFSIHAADTVSPAGTGIYFECGDLDARVSALRVAGVVFDRGPVDQSWLWREAWLRDPDGNRVCLYFAGGNRVDPPWKIGAASEAPPLLSAP